MNEEKTTGSYSILLHHPNPKPSSHPAGYVIRFIYTMKTNHTQTYL